MYVLAVNHLIWRREYTAIEGNPLVGNGEEERETIRPDFDRSIMTDFQGAKITSDTGFLLLREKGERFGILGPIGSEPAAGVDHQALDQGRTRQVHVASAFPWAGYYRAVFGRRARWNNRLMERRRVRYAQRQDKKGFFVNVTAVLSAFGRVGHPTDTLLGSAEVSRRPQGCQNGQNGKTAA